MPQIATHLTEDNYLAFVKYKKDHKYSTNYQLVQEAVLKFIYEDNPDREPKQTKTEDVTILQFKHT